VHTALQTKTPLAHAACEVDQAKRSDSVNIGDGRWVSRVTGRISKSAVRGQQLAPQNGTASQTNGKGKLKAVRAENPRMKRGDKSSNIIIRG
jgi:hypothetical protein